MYLEVVFVFLLLIFLPAAVAAELLPHIFVITVDTLRRDHVGCYGYNKPTTPNIDALAKESCLFENSFANSSWTIPSYMSFFTGLYPGAHRATDYKTALPEHIETLTQVLRRNGYLTGGIVSSPTLSAQFGFDRGFDYYDDFSIVKGKELNLFEEDDYPTLPFKSETSEQVTYLAERWTNRAGDKGKPIFLFLHYFDPHHLYLCHRPEISCFENGRHGVFEGKLPSIKEGMDTKDLEHIIALYDSEIRYADKHIGLFLDFLKRKRLYHNALIVFFADHGEEFLDHGGNYHGHTLYNELIAVPVMLKLPHQKQHVKVGYQVSLVDLMPTILDLLDIEKPSGLAGKSLLEGKEVLQKLPQREIYFETDYKKPLKALMKGEYKLIRNMQNGSLEAYNTEEDYGEKKNIFTSSSDFSQLRQQIEHYYKTLENRGPVTIPKLDEHTIEHLRALGYL